MQPECWPLASRWDQYCSLIGQIEETPPLREAKKKKVKMSATSSREDVKVNKPNGSNLPASPLSYSQVLHNTRRQYSTASSNLEKVNSLSPVCENKTLESAVDLSNSPPKSSSAASVAGSTNSMDEDWSADAFRFVQPRRLSSWVHDDAVSACFQCHAEFTLLLRKHHCRACGRIFCNACSSQRLAIPSDYEASPLVKPSYIYSSLATDAIGSSLDWLSGGSTGTIDNSTTITPKITKKKTLMKKSVAALEASEALREREKFLTSVQRLQEHYPALVKGFTSFENRKSRSLSTEQRRRYALSSSASHHHRVCDACAIALCQRRTHEDTVKVLELCEFDIKELRVLGQVCRKWHRASILCLSSFRQIQYYLPSHVLTSREKRLIRINCPFLAGHSKWMIQLLKASDWLDHTWTSQMLKTLSCKAEDRPYGCMMTMCSRLCKPHFEAVDAYDLLEQVTVLQEMPPPMMVGEQEDRQQTTFRISYLNTLKSLAVKALSVASNEEWISFIPMLCHNLQLENTCISQSVLGKTIIDHAVSHDVFRNDLYWALNVSCEDRRYRRRLDAFKQKLMLASGASDTLSRGQELMQMLGSLPPRLPNADAQVRLRNAVERSEIFKTGPIALPLDPAVRITGFMYKNVEVKSSAEAPMVIPCDVEESPAIPYRLLYKLDDLRKDRIVQNIIQNMYTILTKETKLDVHVVTYRVVPTSTTDGMIEMVEKAETLYRIIRDYGSIMNFLHRYNGHRTMKEIRASFRESLAAYTVITFLIGAGDRHADNVMLTRDGILFHIDYGFILGKDPKPLQPPMRLDTYMMEALGTDVEAFKELCVVAFNCLRRHVGLFMVLLTYVVKATPAIVESTSAAIATNAGGESTAASPGGGGEYTLEELEAFIVERFLPGQSDEEAAVALKLRMEGKLNERIGMTLSDFVHAHTNEQTVSRSMSNVSETVNNVASSITSGASSLYSYISGSAPTTE